MTLCELLDVLDYSREGGEKIQIVRPECDWDEVDEVSTSSCLLVPFYSAKIKVAGVIDDAIRVEIDWKELDSRLHIFGWDKEKKNG